MKPDYTDITIILDRSGSMNSLASLVQFNTRKETTFTATPICKVAKLDGDAYRPTGGIALLDAVALTIDETGRRLETLAKDDRPSKVIVAILTDGLENQSRQFNYAQVRQRIGHQDEVYHWDFVFLGANQDAIAEAATLSIGADSAHVRRVGQRRRSSIQIVGQSRGR